MSGGDRIAATAPTAMRPREAPSQNAH